METLEQTDRTRAALQFAMVLSLAVGLLMLGIKVGAYYLTGSAAILSDAAESVVHVVAVAFAAYSLRVSFLPSDSHHLYGHEKISFFSAGFEGSMIAIAAIYIIYEAVRKWMAGLELENLHAGTALTFLAAAINGSLGLFLLLTGRKRNSLILEANGKHVLTDCYTSVGVLTGLALTQLTGWLPWDPICAVLVALNILYSGFGLIRQSISGLMDEADPGTHRLLTEILDRETERHGITYHHLSHRNLGASHWVDVHLLFPGQMPIRAAHAIATEIEHVIENAMVPRAHATSHLEATEDHQDVHQRKPH